MRGEDPAYPGTVIRVRTLDLLPITCGAVRLCCRRLESKIMNVPTLFAYASSQRSPKLPVRSVGRPVGLRRLFVGLVCAGLLSLPALAVEVTEDDLLLLDKVGHDSVV